MNNSQDILINMIGALFGSLVSAILAVWFTLWFIEGKKQRNRKSAMIALMSRISASVRETEQNLKKESRVLAIFSKFRSDTIWSILETETFDYKKDKKIIEKLSELATYIDTYDELVTVHNQALSTNREMSNSVYSLLVKANGQIRKKFKEVESALDQK
ncbi:hypothetical protein [Paenibacillus taichungensis]